MFTGFKKQKIYKKQNGIKNILLFKKNIAEGKKGGSQKNEVLSNISPKAWCQIPVKKTYSKITPLIKNAPKDWIFNHDHVKQSAFASDIMKVCIDNSNKKVVMPK